MAGKVGTYGAGVDRAEESAFTPRNKSSGEFMYTHSIFSSGIIDILTYIYVVYNNNYYHHFRQVINIKPKNGDRNTICFCLEISA